jgi:hypothetical protein
MKIASEILNTQLKTNISVCFSGDSVTSTAMYAMSSTKPILRITGRYVTRLMIFNYKLYKFWNILIL